MYRHSPVRNNQRSKGFKTKHAVQLCLLIAVCFWLLFQAKRSHDKKKEFHETTTLKFGRKDVQPKLEEETTTGGIQILPEAEEDTQEHDQDEEDKIEDGGDDEIDENELEKSNMEIDRDEVDIVDEEDKESEGEENEEKDVETRAEEDGSTHETREEHYQADDASSAVITHNPFIKNKTLSEDVGTLIEEKDSESMNATLTNNSGMLKSNAEDGDSKSENNKEDPTHLEDLETVPDIETTDTAAE